MDYTVIVTRYDEIVTPYTSGFLSGPSVNLTNITVQDRCPLDLSEHLAMSYGPNVYQLVRNALDRTGPASPAFQPLCL